ncbi:hypothetical protein CHS0354_042285 [Potamilus streckersoni]|uniref:Uncharacterized protein n=1 Tax=Potamilus streckersoni TaxID=2493646 RepID=A0AAE0SUH7_9BIVA|nr:hypothetical protein CHS0354_042285 [Potamilus streckersoni]
MKELVKKATRPGKNMNDLEALEKSIIEFNALNLKEDADLLHAKNVLNNGRVEIVLKDAILRGRTDVLEKAIKMASESGFADDPPILSKAKQELDKLNNTHNPLEITPKTITELRGYTDPPKVIHDVMMATFMLLGENQHDLEVWQTIQYLIRQPEKLIRQMKNFDEKKVSRKTYIDVMEIFQRVDEVEKASLAAAAFRNWGEKVLASIMPTPLKGQKYSSIKKDCLERGVLFEDPEFPANTELDSDVEWKRPRLNIRTSNNRIRKLLRGEKYQRHKDQADGTMRMHLPP